MNCSCCGRRKKLFESFEAISPSIDVCVECSTLLYKLRDYNAVNNEKEKENCMELITKRKNNKSTKEFEEWFSSFSE